MFTSTRNASSSRLNYRQFWCFFWEFYRFYASCMEWCTGSVDIGSITIREICRSSRNFWEFQKNDLVLLKACIDTSHKLPKLQTSWMWQFKILDKHSGVAYKLDPPLATRIHPVLDVGHCKIFHSDLSFDNIQEDSTVPSLHPMWSTWTNCSLWKSKDLWWNACGYFSASTWQENCSKECLPPC